MITRRVLALFLLAMSAIVALPTGAFAADCSYPACPPPEISLNRSSVRVGGRVLVSGSFWCASSSVSISLGGTNVASGSVKKTGMFNQNIQIPSSTPTGDSTITVTGTGVDCVTPASVSVPIKLTSSQMLAAAVLTSLRSELGPSASIPGWVFGVLAVGLVGIFFAPVRRQRRHH